MIRVHAADGTVIVSLGPSYGEWLPYDRIPTVMRDAMVSVEDRRFRSHIGVDPIGLMRSAKLAVVNRGSGRRLQGASTITQQVARTIFLSNKYDVGRKIREAILALAMERKFTKDQILELYLNKVYFGGGAYGIDAAAPPVLRPWRGPSDAVGGRGGRRPGQGAVALFADRRRRGGDRPCRRGHPADAGNGQDHRGAGGNAPIPRASRSRPSRSRTASAISPTGRCPSSRR